VIKIHLIVTIYLWEMNQQPRITNQKRKIKVKSIKNL